MSGTDGWSGSDTLLDSIWNELGWSSMHDASDGMNPHGKSNIMVPSNAFVSLPGGFRESNAFVSLPGGFRRSW
jgi:hypothetical protein